ncbi:5'-3' exonuclease H3TH domain-containing protein [Sodalis sp. CWE]|uniref:5'-3' exonuclease n=1 Tax=Sodalis sp. CWE TaxID=2803816 RepID=UPI001C7E195C|nr:5'-3' exonuclease H3TH domain-containing protein [Sodalis sp. CWE]MBX4180973.1 hypothetical protein [Sodalis sp. CWE]
MDKDVNNPVILVDGSFYLYRSYYALPYLINTKGEPTGAMYGVLNVLKKLLTIYRKSLVIVVFDAKGKTFRNKLFNEYKSHRSLMPSDLINQIEPLNNVIKAIGLPTLTINNVEADDVIGTLALTYARDGRKVLISTGDKDLTQLVSPKIALIDIKSNTIFGPKEIQSKFGLPPELFVDYLALTGDSSDNIPGVPGIGKKTAKTLLIKIGKLERLYQQLNVISKLKFHGAKFIADKLKKHREVAFLSYQLATIKTNISLDLFYKQLTMKLPDIRVLTLLFQHYEFKNYLDDLEKRKEWLNSRKHFQLLSIRRAVINHI